MAQSGGLGNIVTIGIVAVGGYFVYQWFFGSAAPAGVPSTATLFQGVGGGTQAAPRPYDVWLNSAGQVVAVYSGSAWVTSAVLPNGSNPIGMSLTQYAAAVTSAATTSSTGTTTSGTQPIPNPNALTVAQIYSQLQTNATNANPTAVSGGVLMLTPDQFNYYLAQVFTPAGAQTSPYGWPPDALQVWPGIDRSQTMTLANYWAGMSQYLTSRMGLSGFRTFAGLGMLSTGPLLGYFPRASVENNKLLLN